MHFYKSNKLVGFKYRFVSILNYVGSENARLAATEIAKLPDYANNGFHDAYLSSKLISITLKYIDEKELENVKNDLVKTCLLSALFGQISIEENNDESIDNVFISCRNNPDKSLKKSLESLIEEADTNSYEFCIEERNNLKNSCDLFIEFYEKNKSDIDIASGQFPDTVHIKDTHKGPQADDLQQTVFLSNPEEKCLIENKGSLIISNLRPCIGLVLLAENNDNGLACSAYHHMSCFDYKQASTHTDHLYSHTSELIAELAEKNYTKRVRLFITGCDFSTFPLALAFIIDFWNKNKIQPIADLNTYLLPSPQNIWGYCLVKLANDSCTIRAGSELYDKDRSLCKERGIYFEDPNVDSFDYESSQSNDEYSENSSQHTFTGRQTQGFFNSSTSPDNDTEIPLYKKRKLS